MAQLAANVNVDGDRLVVLNPLPYGRDAIVDIPGHAGKRFLVEDLPPSGYRTYPLAEALESDKSSTGDNCDTATLENKFLRVILDRAKGGIVSIVDKKTRRELMESRRRSMPLANTFTSDSTGRQSYAYDVGCEHIDSVYGFFTGWNVRADVPADVPYTEAVPTYATMSVRKDGLVQTAQLSAAPAGLIAANVTTRSGSRTTPRGWKSPSAWTTRSPTIGRKTAASTCLSRRRDRSSVLAVSAGWSIPSPTTPAAATARTVM